MHSVSAVDSTALMPVIKSIVHTGNCGFGIQWNKIND